MKRLITHLLLLLSLLWITACSSDDDNNNPTPEPGSEVQFKIGFGSSTRAATDATFNSTFEEGDQIGIFALKAGVTTVVAQNVKLTRQANGSWTSEQKIYYPLDGSNLDFYAYYPYQGDSNTTLDNISFAVLADQSTAGNYSQSDLLTAKAMDQSSNLVGLSFTHLMAMVQVTTTEVFPVPAFREGAGGFEVVLKNVKRSTTAINWTTNTAELSPSATAQDISMYRVPTTDGSWVFRALLPSQAIAAGVLFEFKQTLQGNVIDMAYSIATVVTPATAKAASYKVKLDYQLDADHQYALGDVYPYKGTPVGIVYWLKDPVNNKSKHGKIVSLNEGTNLRWNEWRSDVKATNLDNGIENMNGIKNNPNGKPFECYNWVHAKNKATEDYNDANAKGIWYLPAKNELQHLYCAYNGVTPRTWGSTPSPAINNPADRTTFNSKLTAAGGTGLTNNWYWSSSEVNDYSAWQVDFSDGSTSSTYTKGIKFRVRAVSAF